MTDVHTPEQRSKNMSAIRGKGNKSTEMLLAGLFRANRITGWRRHMKSIEGKPDFTFPKKKAVVFVDGCFWHGCKRCYKSPETNREFWEKKITSNVRRDKAVNTYLRKKGWNVIRVKEHELKRSPASVIRRVQKSIA